MLGLPERIRTNSRLSVSNLVIDLLRIKYFMECPVFHELEYCRWQTFPLLKKMQWLSS